MSLLAAWTSNSNLKLLTLIKCPPLLLIWSVGIHTHKHGLYNHVGAEDVLITEDLAWHTLILWYFYFLSPKLLFLTPLLGNMMVLTSVCSVFSIVCFKCGVLGCWVWAGHMVTRVIRFTRLNVFSLQARLSFSYFLAVSLSTTLCSFYSANLSHTGLTGTDAPWFTSGGSTCRPNGLLWERGDQRNPGCGLVQVVCWYALAQLSFSSLITQ